jgi:hypothetical protein
MRTQSIKAGDIVECDVRGQFFFARVVDTSDKIGIEPLSRQITFRQVTARQIVGHYRKATGSR